jgi:hypothetical protein
VDPKTVFEKADATLFPYRRHGGAVLGRRRATRWRHVSLHVPGRMVRVEADGSANATLLLNPDEGLAIAEWLKEAFHAIDRLGPPLYDNTETT